ncbi:uncharacterized protein [Palaemon carinicauda]|uniref:uncharacterized protein n=1 Tax=Palaemon carinicauda TaxID=392227 RepID=UPI0035B68816
MKLTVALVFLGVLLATCQVEGQGGRRGRRPGKRQGNRRMKSNKDCSDLLKPSSQSVIDAIEQIAQNTDLLISAFDEMSVFPAVMTTIGITILQNENVIDDSDMIDETAATDFLTSLLDENFPDNTDFRETILGAVPDCVTEANAETTVFLRVAAFRKCLCGDSHEDSSEG